MKANELQIGDFMLYNDDNCIVDEIRVDNTVVLTALNTDVTSIDGDQVSVDEITPIPFTAEILEKNGFIKQAFDGWMLRTENYSIMWRIDYGEPNLIIDSWSAAYGTFNKFGISFVHQLQHALRLCNIDKEIEL